MMHAGHSRPELLGISVIMPAYNGARFYAQAMASIQLQAWPELEIIVVDDGSADELAAEIVRVGIPVVALRQERKGPAAARNLGLRHVTKDLVAFLDIDDTWTAGHLERMAGALVTHPEAGFVQGLIRQVSEYADGRVLISGAYRMPHLGSCMMRRELLQAMGGFDEGMMIGEDYDFLFRCWEQDVPKVDVNEVSLHYRRHESNMTLGKRNQGHVAVAQRRIQRIRSGKVDPAVQHAVPFGEYSGNIENFWKDQVEMGDPCKA